MRRCMLGSSLAALTLCALPAAAQNTPLGFAGTTSSLATAGPSVVGTDGILYQATSSFSYTVKSLFKGGSTSGSTSQLFAYDPSKKLADQTLKFTGWASALAIGSGNRLFLVVGKTLYLIPTPFPAGVPSGALLDKVALDVTDAAGLPTTLADSRILKVDLGGSALAVKVKSAGSAEYLYIDTFDFQWSPFKMSSKVLILNASDGSKIREVTVE